MTGDAPDLLVYALASLAAVALLSLAGLRAWRGWLELRRTELTSGGAGARTPDLAGLRARVKRLEAIASGLEG